MKLYFLQVIECINYEERTKGCIITSTHDIEESPNYLNQIYGVLVQYFKQ